MKFTDQITAVEMDISYCESEIEKLKLQLNCPVNSGFAKKEIEKTEEILKSHSRRLKKYQDAEIAEMDLKISEARDDVDAQQGRKDFKALDTLLTQKSKFEKSIAAKSYTGKKYKKCVRCSGGGMHAGGVCYGCNGSGSVKTAAFKKYLGDDDLPY